MCEALLLSTFLLFGSTASLADDQAELADYYKVELGVMTGETLTTVMGEPVYIDKNPDGRSVFLYDTAPEQVTGFLFNTEGILIKIVVYEK